jgi:hypothetical protein
MPSMEIEDAGALHHHLAERSKQQRRGRAERAEDDEHDGVHHGVTRTLRGTTRTR